MVANLDGAIVDLFPQGSNLRPEVTDLIAEVTDPFEAIKHLHSKIVGLRQPMAGFCQKDEDRRVKVLDLPPDVFRVLAEVNDDRGEERGVRAEERGRLA